MDSYSSPSFSSESSSQSPEAVMDQLKAHLAQAYAEEFLEKKECLDLDAFMGLPIHDVVHNYIIDGKGQVLLKVYHKAWDKLERE
ncbi:mitochondrial import inner membrane translocase subunit TIM13-like isoform X2 [Asparagus officinalis]|uniref:mitochondrial import inner membrane translocase subunit TIM13-like isoform X2 n=1 Tax=Asparagus officinalis TaxID=4686 RepID=UPI00098E584C|nr:mitochondrial import inner membrane translocase subunit TIM13-like isoform X2 [Asparagus officinalis]